jgi:hypothetical protein
MPKTEQGKREIGPLDSLVDPLAVEVAGKGREELVFTGGPNGAPAATPEPLPAPRPACGHKAR